MHYLFLCSFLLSPCIISFLPLSLLNFVDVSYFYLNAIKTWISVICDKRIKNNKYFLLCVSSRLFLFALAFRSFSLVVFIQPESLFSLYLSFVFISSSSFHMNNFSFHRVFSILEISYLLLFLLHSFFRTPLLFLIPSCLKWSLLSFMKWFQLIRAGDRVDTTLWS